VFIAPYSAKSDNILVVGPISGDKHQEILFPIISPDPETNSNVNYLKYPIYAGGNRGRGQVNPTGDKSNNNPILASASGQITDIQKGDNGGYTVSIKTSTGDVKTTTIPKNYDLSFLQVKLLSKINC